MPRVYTRQRAMLLFLAGVAFLLTPGSALRAQQTPPAAAVAEAKELFQKGAKLFEQKLYVQALGSFQASLGHVRRHSTLLWIGHCYRMMGWVDRALTCYEQFLAMVEQERIRMSRTVIDDVGKLVKNLRPLVAADQEGQRLMADKKHEQALARYSSLLQQTPWPLAQLRAASCSLALGRTADALDHAARALQSFEKHLSEWRGSDPRTDAPDQTEVQGWIEKLHGLRAEARRAAREASRATVTLQGLPAGAEVLIDGKAQGSAPLAGPLRLDAGRRQLRVQARGLAPFVQTLDLEPGREVTVQVRLVRPERRRSTLWLAMSIALATLAVGSEVLAWASYAQTSEGGTYSWDSRFQTYEALTTAGHVMAGICALASGASLVLWERSERLEPAPYQGPGVAVVPGPGSLVVSGAVSF